MPLFSGKSGGIEIVTSSANYLPQSAVLRTSEIALSPTRSDQLEQLSVQVGWCERHDSSTM